MRNNQAILVITGKRIRPGFSFTHLLHRNLDNESTNFRWITKYSSNLWTAG